MEVPRASTLDEAFGQDAGLHVPGQRKDPSLRQGPVVSAVAVGGGPGATARYGASLPWPTAADVFP